MGVCVCMSWGKGERTSRRSRASRCPDGARNGRGAQGGNGPRRRRHGQRASGKRCSADDRAECSAQHGDQVDRCTEVGSVLLKVVWWRLTRVREGFIWSHCVLLRNRKVHISKKEL